MEESEAFVRLIGAGLALIAAAPPDHTVYAFKEFLTHCRAASAAPDSFRWSIAENGIEKFVRDPGNRAVLFTLASLATMTAVLIHRDDDAIAAARANFDPLNFPAGSLDQNMIDALTNSASGDAFLAKTAAAVEFLAGDWTSETERILSHAAEPTLLAAALREDDWQQALLKTAADQAAANNLDFGKAMAEIVLGVDQAVAPVLEESGTSAVGAFRTQLIDAVTNGWKAIANGFGELSDKYEEASFAVGHVYSPEEMRSLARGFDAAVHQRVAERKPV